MFVNTKLWLVLVCFLLTVFLFQFTIIECYAVSAGPDEWSYVIADFNSDGSPDVLVASRMGKGNRIWFNNGIGEFYPSDQMLGYTYAGDIAVGDLDSDGDIDIFIANLDAPNKVWLNDSRGYFMASGQEFEVRRSVCVSLGDMDSDGDKDAVVIYSDGTIEIFSNNGAGFFDPIQTLKGDKGITSIEFKDVNNDKAVDIVCFRNGQATSGFVNYGNSRFAKYDGKVDLTARLSDAALDITGDGKPDGIFINNEGEPSVANYYGDHPILGATGGPDSYGYVWEDTGYSWVTATANTWTPTSEDEVSGAIPLGFTFNFYGTDYASVYITSDGYLQFSDPFASTVWNWPIYCESSAAPNSAAYGFGTELDPIAGGRIYYESLGTAPNRYFVLTYDAVLTAGDDNRNRFQIILYEGENRIKYNYVYTVPDYSYATIGIENPAGTVRLLSCRRFCSPPDSSAIQFYLAPEIELYRSGTDMPTGSSYNFGRVAVGNNSSVTFTINNTGRANLILSSTSITGTNASQFGITTSPLSPVAALGGSTTVTVRFQPTAEGVMEAQLQIANDDPSENPYIINLYGGGDDNAPAVGITNPADGSTVAGIVNIDANATDDIGINRIEFYRDNTLIGTDTTAPYGITYNFSALSPGSYIIKALAFDTLNQTAMDVIKVTIAGSAPPTVAITNPADGSTVTGTVNIDANATDDAGVSRVEFYLDNTIIGTDTAPSYGITYDFSLVAPGTYLIKAIAYDTINQTAVDAIKVNVAGVGPAVNITNPMDGAAVSNIVIIEASATAIAGIDRVEFRIDGSLLCTDTSAPYQCSWDTRLLPYGNYTISATVVDIHGLTAVDTITVRTTDGPPLVKITEPASGAYIFGTTVIKADAWDNIRVKRVDFYVNGSFLCSDTEAPYECTWNALMVPIGIYTIKAAATDNLAQTGTDTITVQRRVQVNLSVTRKTEKAWIIKKDYAEVLVTLPDYGVADLSRLQILRSDGSGSFEVVKDVLASELQNNAMQFLDKYLDSGKSYTYKVIVFDSNWQLIGESDLITI